MTTKNTNLRSGVDCEKCDRSPFIDALPISFPGVPLDAIFVPTHRKNSIALSRLNELAALADVVCVLASGSAAPAFQAATLPQNVRIVAETLIGRAHTAFLTRPSSRNPTVVTSATYDLPTKRNIAIQLARQWGLRRICLLDDDILIERTQIRAATAALSEKSPMAGFYVFDFPDVSTIDHIHRLVTGVPSQTMPGGNCLFLLIDHVEGFFPYVYNEDWIFVMHNGSRRPGSAHGAVVQAPSLPWSEPGRARFEEFGETIICGALELGGLIDAPEVSSTAFWSDVLRLRRDFLVDTRDSCASVEHRVATEDALAALNTFSADDCTKFVLDTKAELADQQWLRSILNTA